MFGGRRNLALQRFESCAQVNSAMRPATNERGGPDDVDVDRRVAQEADAQLLCKRPVRRPASLTSAGARTAIITTPVSGDAGDRLLRHRHPHPTRCAMRGGRYERQQHQTCAMSRRH